MGISARLSRIGGMLLRHFYILRSSPARVIDIMFWPTVQMVLWGFISRFFALRLGAEPSTLAYAFGALLGAVLLWDLLFRTQIAVFISYLEEIWARNVGSLFISPLRPGEWWLSIILFSFLRVAIGLLPAALLAIPFYGFSIFDLGLPLLAFFINLMMMGWWIGFFVIALLVRAGPGAEGLGWAICFLIAPFCAVYYPVTVLPDWLQPVALALPATHVFEGLRALVERQSFEINHMLSALWLNLVYLALSFVAVQLALRASRKTGMLLQGGD
jgi:ABC-2 type transport system permease protein